MAVTVLYVIVGFTIYFNNPGLNKALSIQQKDKGIVVFGVHSPEFRFEKNYTNVKAAVQRFGITYPVILDSDHGTWNAYGNQYWPRFYLIDTQGYIQNQRHSIITEC
ncbi:MAG: redoxin family protein [Candidatus Nitrosopolaris sp.]